MQKAQNKFELSFNTVVGLCAIVTSICAIIITLYQTRLQKIQQLCVCETTTYELFKQFFGCKKTGEDDYHYEFLIVNQGLGPAIVSDYDFYYKSKRYKNITEILKQIKNDNKLTVTKSVVLTNLWKNEILPVGEKLSLININDERLGPLVEKANIKIMVQYKSLYGQEWRFISNNKLNQRKLIKF